MDDRYKNQVAEVLREKTVASDATALEYLAACGALQQFKQVSLAYLLMRQKQKRYEGLTGASGSSSSYGTGGPRPSRSDGGGGSNNGAAAAASEEVVDWRSSITGPLPVPACRIPRAASPSLATLVDGAWASVGTSGRGGLSAGDRAGSSGSSGSSSSDGVYDLDAAVVAALAAEAGVGAVVTEGGQGQRGMIGSELSAAAEGIFQRAHRLQVCFDAQEAMEEMARLGLCEVTRVMVLGAPPPQPQPPSASAPDPGTQDAMAAASAAAAPVGSNGTAVTGAAAIAAVAAAGPVHAEQADGAAAEPRAAEHTADATATEQDSPQSLLPAPPPPPALPEPPPSVEVDVYGEVVGLAQAVRLVQQHWDGLLWSRVDAITREFE